MITHDRTRLIVLPNKKVAGNCESLCYMEIV